MSLKTYAKLLKLVKKIGHDFHPIVLVAIIAMLVHLIWFVEMPIGAKFEITFSMILALYVLKKLNAK